MSSRRIRTPPRPSTPASAGSASTSTRTRTRCSSVCSSCGWAIGRDLCVVGDEDQTIYTFTGATSGFLTGFAERHPGARVIELAENYRSSAAGPRAREQPARVHRPRQATGRHPAGGAGTGRRPARDRGGRTDRPRALGRRADRRRDRARPRSRSSSGSTPSSPRSRPRFTRAGIAYQVRGVRFFDRADVRGAIDLVRRAGFASTGPALAGDIRALWAAKLGYDDDIAAGHAGEEARERTAALDTLLDILGTQARSDARVDADGVPRPARPATRGGARGLGRRREPAHLPPRQGSRVGCGRAAGARGGPAADPPGLRRRRAPRRGGPPPVRRDHPGPDPPVDLVGGRARDARPDDPARAEPVPGGPSTPRRASRDPAPGPVRAGPGRPPDGQQGGRRQSVRRRRRRSAVRGTCAAGGRPGPEPMPSRRTSSSTTRPWPPSRTSSHPVPRRFGG